MKIERLIDTVIWATWIVSVIAIFSLMSQLGGCASQQNAINSLESSAIVTIRAAEDNNIRMWSANACGTPYSAAIRNPAIVPALKALCLPGGNATDPASLLDVILPAKKP